MKEYIKKFIEKVYPEAPNLALQMFNEEVCLKDATKRIADLEREVKERNTRILEQDTILQDLIKSLKEKDAQVKRFREKYEINQ